jgi:CBS domain-containing protein
MTIQTILNGKGDVVYTIDAAKTLSEAASFLDRTKVGAIVVVDAGGAVCGVLSERDIIRQIARSGEAALTQSVADSMTRAVITVDRTETIDVALARMTDRRIRHLPVIEDGRLVGIVSIGDLVKHKIAAATAEAEAMKNYIMAG